MITNIWLKAQPKKKLPFLDCYPLFNVKGPKTREDYLFIKDDKEQIHATFLIDQISRLEFRPS